MKILVIGGTGLIGAPLVRQLRATGIEVAVFHRGNAADVHADTMFIGDRHRLSDYADALRGFRPDIVVDLVLSSAKQATATMDIFRGIARRVVVATSMDVYRAEGVLHGFEPGPLEPLPLTEDSPLRRSQQTYPPQRLKALEAIFGWFDSDYNKVEVEQVVMNDNRLPATVLRLPMIYGPGDRLHRLFPLLKRMDDKRRRIVFAEDVATWRSPRGYGENIAAAITLAATSDAGVGRIYNVCEVEAFSELEWARLVADQAGWDGEFVVVPRERAPKHLLMSGNLAQHWVASSERIRRELGYREPIARDEALRRTIIWERSHPPAQFDPERFNYAAEDDVVAA